MPRRRGKMGRPKLPPEDVRETVLKIKLSKTERDVIARASGGDPLSTWARALLLQAAGYGATATGYTPNAVDSANQEGDK